MQRIDVDGKKFRSIRKASQYINISSSRLVDLLKNKEELVYNNFSIKKINPPILPKKEKKIPNAVRVLQVNTGRVFNTIEEVAKFTGTDGWTISKKMDFSGGFVDKYGNMYKRLKPMKTKNVYSDTSMEVNPNYKGRKPMSMIKNLFKKEQPVEVEEEKCIRFCDHPECVQKLVKNEIAKMIESGMDWK